MVVAHTIGELEDHERAWSTLSERAIEPNIFYEPWMLLPALRSLASTERFEVALVFCPDHGAPQRDQLVGVFPFIRQAHYKGLPFDLLTLWQHRQGMLWTPLVDRDFARPCLETLLTWLSSPEGASLVELPEIGADGPLRHALTDALTAAQLSSYPTEHFTRAMLKPRESVEQYLQLTFSGETRRRLRKAEQRLSALGRLRYVTLDEEPDGFDGWASRFVSLEGSGWKRGRGTSFVQNPADRAFFERAMLSAHQQKRLHALSMYLDDKPLAMRAVLTAQSGSFAYKCAYDEGFAKHSPGLLLEVEGLRRFHHRPAWQWTDSCAVTHSPQMNRLWLDRRAIETLLIATRGEAADLLVTATPLLRWAKRKASSLRADLSQRLRRAPALEPAG